MKTGTDFRFKDWKNRIKEIFRYGIVGLSTTLINLAVYHILLGVIDYKTANLSALIVSKIYGYFANKTIVFRSKTDDIRSWAAEVLKFIGARGFTAVVDYFGLIVAVEVLGFSKVLSKYLIQIIVIVLNYILGKYVVFKGDKESINKVSKLDVQEYNTGNIDKYRSKNSLKRKMVTMLHNNMIEIVDRWVNVKEKTKILDAGCGEGFFSSLLKNRYPEAEIVGCDGAEEALDIARRNVSGVRFETANLYELPYRDQEFEVVICSEVLEHLTDPKVALKEVHRVGKKVLITVPHEPWFRLGNLMALHNVSRLGDPVDHINHWTYNGFKRFIKKQGLFVNQSFGRSFPWSIFWSE